MLQEGKVNKKFLHQININKKGNRNFKELSCFFK